MMKPLGRRCPGYGPRDDDGDVWQCGSANATPVQVAWRDFLLQLLAAATANDQLSQLMQVRACSCFNFPADSWIPKPFGWSFDEGQRTEGSGFDFSHRYLHLRGTTKPQDSVAVNPFGCYHPFRERAYHPGSLPAFHMSLHLEG